MSHGTVASHAARGFGSASVTRSLSLGTAYSLHALVVFLKGAGAAEPEATLDDPRWVERRGGPAHESSAA